MYYPLLWLEDGFVPPMVALAAGAGVEWAAAFDLFHYAFLSASLIGFSLAFLSDDVRVGSLRWSWIAMQLLPLSRLSHGRHVAFEDVEGILTKAARETTGHKSRLRRVAHQFIEAACEGRLLQLLSRWRSDVHAGSEFLLQAMKVKFTSEGRRHFFYQIQKVGLGLPNRKGETELRSYLDIKEHMRRKELWPFAFEVSDVKGDRITCEGKKAIPMSSYSYLDFLREPLVQEAALAAGKAWSTGNHGARMLGGNARILRQLERVVGQFFGREDSLLCATGFLAAMSGVCAAAKEGDLVIGDSRLHPSIRAGMKMCGAKELIFRHNNWDHLRQLVSRHRRRHAHCWIVVESVYSMDGDIADLPTLKKLAEEFNCRIFVDEAHGLGVLGKTGRGLEEHFNMPNTVDVIVGTFSKSIAGVGGYIVGDRDFVDFLDFHAPGSVFSAPLTAYSAGGAIKAFELMQGEQRWRIKKAQENAVYLRHALRTGSGHWPPDYPSEHKFCVEGMDCTTVIPVIFPHDAYRLCRVTRRMLNKGWMVAAAIFPACPMATPRIRVTATAAYNIETMDRFVKDLVETAVECPPSTELTDEEVGAGAQRFALTCL